MNYVNVGVLTKPWHCQQQHLAETFLECVHLHGEGRLKDKHRQKDEENDMGVCIHNGHIALQNGNLFGHKAKQHAQQQQHHGVWKSNLYAPYNLTSKCCCEKEMFFVIMGFL